MGQWTVLDDVAIADCALQIGGESLGDLFATAAHALADVMVDPLSVQPSVQRTMTLSAPSIDLLLFDWLSELIALKDSERLVFTRVDARVSPGSPCRLSATMAGGAIGPETIRRADPKAVTLHLFEVAPLDGGWRARIVLDI